MARAQSVLPPVRIARILAGEGVGQFSVDDSRRSMDSERASLPLSVALDYVGTILDDSSGEIARLKVRSLNYIVDTLYFAAFIHLSLTTILFISDGGRGVQSFM